MYKYSFTSWYAFIEHDIALHLYIMLSFDRIRKNKISILSKQDIYPVILVKWHDHTKEEQLQINVSAKQDIYLVILVEWRDHTQEEQL